MCSATIDQIRLRRAVTLPLVSQKVVSSGFQSEIQVGSFDIGSFELIEISFARSGQSGRRPKAWQRTPGAVRRSGVKSDDWLFGDGIDGVGNTPFKLCAKPLWREKRLYYR